ncbi:hypothetical protein FB107DRAFT_277516 [Schizophyllum commune]
MGVGGAFTIAAVGGAFTIVDVGGAIIVADVGSAIIIVDQLAPGVAGSDKTAAAGGNTYDFEAALPQGQIQFPGDVHLDEVSSCLVFSEVKIASA